jgi:phosphatidylglycerophosphate synthase
MTGSRDGAWFGRGGYGSRNLPISWRGWLATILYAIAAGSAFFLPALWQVPYGGLVAFAAFALVTVVFGYVCVRKSRPGRGW